MSLKDKLLEDYKDAMKQKDNTKKNAVGMVRAAILQYEKDNKVILDDNGILNIISKEIKKRKDALPDYIKSGRQELIDELNKEIEILNAYLPPMLSIDEIKKVVDDTINEVNPSGLKEMGKVMQAVLNKIGAGAEAKVVSDIVKERLSNIK